MSDAVHAERVSASAPRHSSRLTLRRSRAFRPVCNVLPDVLMLLVMGALTPDWRGVPCGEEAE